MTSTVILYSNPTRQLNCFPTAYDVRTVLACDMSYVSCAGQRKSMSLNLENFITEIFI